MKKRLYFKNWVENVLLIIFGIAVVFGASECEDTKLFVIKSLICMVVMGVDYLLLSKYGRIFED